MGNVNTPGKYGSTPTWFGSQQTDNQYQSAARQDLNRTEDKKALKAAMLIYKHFRNEFDLPHPQN